MKHNRGVTLIELMVTIAIAAIMMTVAVPNFKEFIGKTRLSGVTMDFLGTLNFARSAAVKLGQPVAICKTYDAAAYPSKHGSYCEASPCSSGSNCWDDGWIVFLNADSGYLDGTKAITTAHLLRTHPGMDTGYSLRSTLSNVAYKRNGSTANASTFVLCQGDQTASAHTVIVNTTSPRIGQDTDKDGIPEQRDGTEISNCSAPT